MFVGGGGGGWEEIYNNCPVLYKHTMLFKYINPFILFMLLFLMQVVFCL